MDRTQISESFRIAFILALTGGFLDAYSYICRGGVFANSETGNIVLLALNLVSFDFAKAINYLIPIIAYVSGVVISLFLQSKSSGYPFIHWHSLSLALEFFALIAVAFMPESLNIEVNSIISMTCAIQVTSFSKFYGNAMATTMCTGNLKSGTLNLFKYIRSGDIKCLKTAQLYYLCIISFMIGAVIGYINVKYLGIRSSLVAAGFPLIAILILFTSKRNERHI